ncbi:MAG: phosphoglycerate kinase [Candidatus Melainabacteria bacterium]|nr:phosphoglycerate kinase [Candidatus Melainabacteria bacterium]MBI3308556.1 phosphoglycerate kinase [Candidatus Melainabacteria bacterium]
MEQLTIKDIPIKDLEGKRVLVRVDYNVPLKKGGKSEITNDLRIKASLPTIQYLIDAKAKVILVSHLGRPKGFDSTLKLDPVANRLSELLGKKVIKLNDSIGPEVESVINKLQPQDVCLLENIRFYKEEEKNDPDFARKLAKPFQIYVNDAFGTSHRAHASTAGISAHLNPSLAGLLLEKEVDSLNKILSNPVRPLTTIIGGSKISTKINILKTLVSKVDTILIGGAMAFTFIKAKGGEIGDSLYEQECISLIGEIDKLKEEHAVALILPEDMVCAKSSELSTQHSALKKELHIYPIDRIPPGYMGLDIGPKTIEKFTKMISQSMTIFWNGPMGMFEDNDFTVGTKAVAEAMEKATAKRCITVIGGGDSVTAIEKFRISFSSFTHVSTGGGAAIEFLEGKTLPGISCLDKKVSIKK